MMRLALACLLLIAFSAQAADTRVHQTDAYGNIQYGKPSYSVEANGRVIQTDAYGNKQYQKQHNQIQGDKIYRVDTYGSRQAQAYVVRGQKVYQTDKYGNQRRQVLEVQGSKVYATDRYGNRKTAAYVLKDRTTKPTRN